MTAVNFDHPMFKEWLQFRYDMENEDKCQVPYADVKSMNMNYRDKFFNGQIAMLPIGSFMIPELDDQDKYPHEFVTTFAPIPAWGRCRARNYLYRVPFLQHQQDIQASSGSL